MWAAQCTCVERHRQTGLFITQYRSGLDWDYLRLTHDLMGCSIWILCAGEFCFCFFAFWEIWSSAGFISVPLNCKLWHHTIKFVSHMRGDGPDLRERSPCMKLLMSIKAPQQVIHCSPSNSCSAFSIEGVLNLKLCICGLMLTFKCTMLHSGIAF